jgi:hypothetical protein
MDKAFDIGARVVFSWHDVKGNLITNGGAVLLVDDEGEVPHYLVSSDPLTQDGPRLVIHCAHTWLKPETQQAAPDPRADAVLE